MTGHEELQVRGDGWLARSLARAVDGLATGSRWERLALAGGIAALFGLLAGWLEPRGPLTSPQALGTMAAALFVGVAGGVASRSRWAMLVGPMAFVAAFEFARLGTDGPTVDSVRLGSFYGLVALVVGRGLDALLILAPMALGVAYGKLAARWLDGTPPGGSAGVGAWVGRSLTGGSTLALLALAALLARPASTPPILGPDGQPSPGSIASLRKIEVNGHDLVLLVRGHSAESPVLLYLAGGPGGTDIGVMRVLGAPLERDFVVATYDQRGAAKSYPALDPASRLTVESAVADLVVVTNYLRKRFDEEKIYLVGNSWGTTLGTLAIQQHPELFHAYIGTGQMVSQRETDRIYWSDTIAWAEAEGRDGLATELRKEGPPPYGDLWSYEPVFAHERDWNPYERVEEYDAKGEMPMNVFVREYTLLEQVRHMGAFLDTFAVLYPRLRDIDFRETATTLEVPVYMVAGAHETHGRAVLADEWFALLDAPIKRRFDFELSGHRPHFEEPQRFAAVLAAVLTETYPGD